MTAGRLSFRRSYPLWLALAFYWGSVFVLLSLSLARSQGHCGSLRTVGYPLDDTYIHMAIGKHFVNDGFWGVSQTGFSSSTSSPLWSAAIALVYAILGVNDWAPLALGLVCGSAILVYGYKLWTARFAANPTSPLRLAVFLLSISYLSLLPVLTLSGMEHILHGLLTVWLLYRAVAYLTQEAGKPRQLAGVMLLSALVTLTRYEGLFLVFAIALLALINRRFAAALWVSAAGLLPVSLYGLVSSLQGEYFLPNSVLLKGNTPVLTPDGLARFWQRLSDNLAHAPHLQTLMLACIGLYVWCEIRQAAGKKERLLIASLALITFLHLLLAGVGWFYRYESYLVLAGCVVLVDFLNTLIRRETQKIYRLASYALILALSLFVAVSLGRRAERADQDYPLAVMNIHDQQVQMGRFLQTYYSGSAVAANDIGAINYLAEIKTLDLFGLGSIEVTRAKLSGAYDRQAVQELVSARQVAVIVIYDSWFRDLIPGEWIAVGQWQIAHNVVCGDDEVTFYAPSAAQAQVLADNLRAFSARLPASVRQSGAYTRP